jgi:hypothetical protein
MDLLERYLIAVAALLPAEQRADITAELRDILLSHLEERRSQLDRELSTEETEEVLRRHGHPVTIAAAYRAQRPFISPWLAPWYWLVLRIVLGVGLIANLVVVCISIASGESLVRVVSSLVPALWHTAVEVTGALTIFALLLDRLGAAQWLEAGLARIAATWRPRNLPKAARPPRPTPIGWSVALDLIGIGLLVLWMTGNAGSVLVIGPMVHVSPVAALDPLQWPLLLIALTQAAVHVMTALGSQRVRLLLGLGVAIKVATLGVLFILLRNWPFYRIVELPANLPAASVTVVERGLHIGMGIGLGITWGVIALITLFGLLWQVRFLRLSLKAATPRSA